MTTTIKYRYAEAPKIFMTEEYHHSFNRACPKRAEFDDWMIATFGKPAHDMTDFNWGKTRWFSRASHENIRGYGARGGWISVPVGIEFIFKNPSDAVMFKVRWA